MRVRTVALGAGAVAAVGGVGVVAGRNYLADPVHRERWRRQARIAWLTGKRGTHFALNKVRGLGADEARRAELDEQFAVKTAEDVAAELGNMKGVMMKLGQMMSFIMDGLPPEAQAALATLQQDVPPMAPTLAEGVIFDDLGRTVDDLFLDWDPVPVAAASIGQVHKAVLHDGRIVAVKVQYPGVEKAIVSDLDNAEMLYAMFSATTLRGLDPKGMVDELRARMADELDYRLEARCQQEFADRYVGHPFIRVPSVVPEASGARVLTSEWVEGRSWSDFEANATEAQRQRAAEVVFRFAQGSVNRHKVFNGDPHPGNYRFHDDGTVTFLDFGLVKRWSDGEWERMSPVLDHVLAHDVAGTIAQMVRNGFIGEDHGLDPEHVFEAVSMPYRAYKDAEFTFDPSYTMESLTAVMDLAGPYGDVIKKLNMPPSFVILDRVVWGVSALLGRLEATNAWRGILDEYRHDGPPATELGEQEAAWAAGREQRAVAHS